MNSRTFALVFGIVFLILGILGFVPGMVQELHPGHPQAMGTTGSLLGLFPVNELHSVVHLVFGLWGLAVYRSAGGSVTYARVVAVIYAVLTVAGLLPQLNTAMGLVPLYGNDVWLHGAIALVAAYFGFVNRGGAAA
ncbi:MAG: DUF4383 domain-containing protein [Sphingosinicella sp.]